MNHCGTRGVILVMYKSAPRLHRTALVSMWLAGLALMACGQSPAANGTITGVASPCVGPAITYSRLPVTVYLTQGARLVAHQTVKGTHTYRFVVPAGSYVVATHEGEGSKPVPVTVRSGQTTHADIPSLCD